MSHFTLSKTNKGCWKCYLQQAITNDTCEDCGHNKFYPIEVPILRKDEEKELNILTKLFEDDDFIGL